MNKRVADSYPTTEKWKANVKATLDAQPRGAYSRLAEHLEIGTGALTGLLKPESKYSQYRVQIDDYFREQGWAEPDPDSGPRRGDDMRSTVPLPTDSDREVTRKNLIRFRDEVGL